MGFPIVNDPLYSHSPIDAGRLPPSCWTDPKLKGLAIAERIRVLASIATTGRFEPVERRTDAYESSAHTFNMACTALLEARANNTSGRGCTDDGVESSSKPDHFDPWCPDCALPPRPDPFPHDMCIYLHARRYAIVAASDKFEFVAPLPSWAVL